MGHYKHEARAVTKHLLWIAEQGAGISWEELATRALDYMSEAEVAEMADAEWGDCLDLADVLDGGDEIEELMGMPEPEDDRGEWRCG
jgi:hypothetical protein